ncbi:hypothetical protein KO353_09370 [Elioraea tepida]|uniref:CRISPR system Cms protein Csm5 n=1 Tax=Elioraea tepida TaxID=2843330 RepID=A0A975U1B3_9PROT|nr:RAMP superfamily CRISPR-associated protein [Elioraea tepida]QXM23538.1 hypothetical protein KO353_09370 [Elioraea tepida]
MAAVVTKQRTVTRILLHCVPLTPLHVGDGTELSLDEYLLETAEEEGQSPRLCRFDPVEAMRRMTAEERTRFRTALDSGRLADASKALRSAGKRCIVERVPVSPRSRAELEKALNDPSSLRSGGVRAFVRSGGRPYIPGSSIKGAFRTALASARLPRDQRPHAWTHELALQAALGLDPGDTSTDPLRFLGVADAELPAGALMIDRAEIIKRGGSPGPSKIQMHYERTCARSHDPADRTRFEVGLTLDSRLGLDRKRLFQLTSRFHWSIWQGERERFFRDHPRTCDAMDRLLRAVKLPGERTAAVAGLEEATNFVLLRLGRFGHFESKSLEHVRRGHVPQARERDRKIRQPGEWGSTRTVTRLHDGTPIPFGWVLGYEKDYEIL